MKSRIPDENVDRLLRDHAARSTPPSLSEEQRTTMISSLLAKDAASMTPARPTRTSLFSALRRPPVLAFAVTAFGILVLVGVGLLRFGAFRSSQETALHSPPAPAAPADSSSPTPTPAQEALRPLLTLASIPTSFMMRGEGDSSPLPSVAGRDSVFSWIQQALEPLGVSATRRGSTLVTTLPILSQSGDSTTLRFVFSIETGEVRAKPATFRIAEPRISEETLRAVLARVSETAYHRFRSS